MSSVKRSRSESPPASPSNSITTSTNHSLPKRLNFGPNGPPPSTSAPIEVLARHRNRFFALIDEYADYKAQIQEKVAGRFLHDIKPIEENELYMKKVKVGNEMRLMVDAWEVGIRAGYGAELGVEVERVIWEGKKAWEGITGWKLMREPVEEDQERAVVEKKKYPVGSDEDEEML